MKKIAILFTIISSVIYAQDFNGLITYKVKFSSDNTDPELNRRIDLLKKDSTLTFMKENENYLEYLPKKNTILIYQAKENKKITIEKNHKNISIEKLENTNYIGEIPEIFTSDSLYSIKSFKCIKILFQFDSYNIEIYYDKNYPDLSFVLRYKLNIDYGIFRQITNNSLIVKIVQNFKQVKTEIEIDKFEPNYNLNQYFTIPKYKKSKKFYYGENQKIYFYKIDDKNYIFPF